MKTARRILAVVFSTWLLVGLARAQIEFVLVEKRVDFTQSSESAPGLVSGTPYSFHFGLSGGGTSTGGLTPVQITTTATGSSVGSVVLTSGSHFNATDNDWKSDTASYSTLTGAGSLDAAYANGVYALNVNGTSFNITLGSGSGPTTYPDGYPTAAPMLTGLSAGDFNGSGQLKIDLSLSSYTFNLNGLTGYTSGGHVGMFIGGVSEASFISVTNSGGNVQAESMYFSPAKTDAEVTFLTFNPSASNMVAGNTYTLELEYNLAPNAGVNALGVNEFDLGLFTYRTTVSLYAIPEPSTYAAIFGALALAGVAIHRRRRAA